MSQISGGNTCVGVWRCRPEHPFFLQNTSCGCFWVFQSHFEGRSNIVAGSGRRVPNFLERKFCGKAVSVVSTKFLHQEIRWNSFSLHSGCTLTNFCHRTSAGWIHTLHFTPIPARKYVTHLNFDVIRPNDPLM